VRIQRSGLYELAGHGFGVAAMFCLRFCSVGGTHVGEPLNLFADSGDSGELPLALLSCDGRVRLIADQQVCAAIRPPTSRTRHGWRALVKCRPNAARWRPTCCRRPSRVRCAEATGVRLNSKPVVPFINAPRATRVYAAWIGTESYRRCSATRPHDQVATTDSNRPGRCRYQTVGHGNRGAQWRVVGIRAPCESTEYFDC
jgi:hypothetical protein